jgi:hypothetical protein
MNRIGAFSPKVKTRLVLLKERNYDQKDGT